MKDKKAVTLALIGTFLFFSSIHRKIDFGNNIQTVLYFTGLIGIGGFLLYRFYKIQPPTKRTWMMWGIYTLIAAGLILYYTF